MKYDFEKAPYIKDISNKRLTDLALAVLDGVDNPYNWIVLSAEINRRFYLLVKEDEGTL